MDLFAFNTLYSILVAFGFTLAVTSFKDLIIDFFEFKHLEGSTDKRDSADRSDRAEFFSQELKMLNGLISDILNFGNSLDTNETQEYMINKLTDSAIGFKNSFEERRDALVSLSKSSVYTNHFNALSLASALIALIMILFSTLESINCGVTVYYERYIFIGLILSTVLLLILYILDIFSFKVSKRKVLLYFMITFIVTLILGKLTKDFSPEQALESWHVGLLSVVYCSLHYFLYFLFVLGASIIVKIRHYWYQRYMESKLTQIKNQWKEYRSIIKPDPSKLFSQENTTED